MRLFIPLVALAALGMAGCGGSSDASADRDTGNRGKQKARADTDKVVTASRRSTRPVEPEAAGATDLVTSKPETEEQLDGAARRWKDSSGTVVATGEFIDLMGEKVCIEEPSGLGKVLELNELCLADQQYVRSQLGDSGSEPVEEPEPVDEQISDAAETLAAAGPAASSGVMPVSTGSSSRRKVVIPFDFESKFDEGDYGKRVGDMVWKKIDREGGFIIPDSMYDVRDLLASNSIKIGPNTPLERVKDVVRNYFQADIGIWGSVERAAGHEWDVYDLVIKCVDFSHEPDPKVIYEKAGVRTSVVSEIPHLYVKEMLDELYEREEVGPPPVDKWAEENWQKNPNLVVGGDFEQGARGVPKGWEARGGQQREPLGGLVSWVGESGYPNNKVIRFTFSKGVGDSTGVMYYSDWFPIDEGAKYRFQCRYRTNGPSPKVFIKCYAEMGSQYQAEGEYRPSPGEYVPESMQRRECYRSQQNLKGPKNTWNVQTEDFTPKHTKYTPKWGKVMLYAYLGGGVVEWDDVVLKQIVPASPSETKKDPRHSMESAVTIEEMRENERRGRESREKLREGQD
jgi:hypothetical protein